ncbi:MAG TPA: hypothetical protein VFI39_01570 [Gemmatimonadales bacterium]|nr:hypothetical protein [Gemmatimonadales bacterium]
MLVRPIALAALTVGVLAGFATDATTTQRYRVDTTNTAELDLTALGGQIQHQGAKLSSFYTVALTDSAIGKALRATLDSVQVDTDSSSSPPPAAMADSARGATATAFLSAGGVLSNLAVATENPLAQQLLPLFQNFYPRMKSTAKVGDKWTDTLDYSTPQGTAGDVHTKVVANWVVTAEEQHDGVKTRKVQSAYSWARNGTMNGAQGKVSLDGTATGAATYWVAVDGRMVGATMNENAAMTITVEQAPAPIPVKSTNVVTISSVK